MAGADRLDRGTGTPVISQRSESGQGILVAKAGRVEYDASYDASYDVVCKAVMSFMSPAGFFFLFFRETTNRPPMNNEKGARKERELRRGRHIEERGCKRHAMT